MKCRKCQREITEGINYCSNCGAPVKRSGRLTLWQLLKRGLPVIFLAVVMILGGMGLGGIFQRNPQKQELPSPTAAEKIDWIATLREDLYSEDSALTRAMAEAVTLKLVGVNEESITVEVTCPDVYEGAMQWFMNVSDENYSDQALEDALLELLKGETSTTTFELPFDAEGSPYCTDAFLDAASGGVRKFYTALTAMLIEEMEASIHE